MPIAFRVVLIGVIAFSTCNISPSVASTTQPNVAESQPSQEARWNEAIKLRLSKLKRENGKYIIDFAIDAESLRHKQMWSREYGRAVVGERYAKVWVIVDRERAELERAFMRATEAVPQPQAANQSDTWESMRQCTIKRLQPFILQELCPSIPKFINLSIREAPHLGSWDDSTIIKRTAELQQFLTDMKEAREQADLNRAPVDDMVQEAILDVLAHAHATLASLQVEIKNRGLKPK